MDNLIGLTIEEAKEVSVYNIRVVCVDEEEYFVTCDYRTDRLNVALTDDKISEVRGVG